MKNRYAIGVALTVIVVVAAVLVSQQRAPQTSREKATLFPELAGRINDVNELVIRDAQNTLTVQLVSDDWGIAEADHYPALVDKVKETVLAVSDLKVIAEKTDNPDLYERLGVEDIDGQGATSTRLTLSGAGEEPLAALIVGNTRRSKSAAGAPGLYVRIAEQQQALLVAGRLSVSADIIDWIKRDIINIERNRVNTVRVQPAGGTGVLLNRDENTDDLALQDIPDGKEQQSEYLLSRMATMLENIYVDGVRKQDNIDFSTLAATVVVTTFDGLTANIEVVESGEEFYARFSFAAEKTATANAETTDETTADSDAGEEMKPTPAQEAEALNKLLRGWAYQLSTSKAELYTRTLEDLVREPEQAAEGA